MTPADLEGTLLDLVSTVPRDGLRPLLRTFDLARDAALLRLLTPEAPRLVPIEEAAEQASLPVRRMRSFARGKSWAHRIGRSLRIDVAAMLADVRRA